MTNSLCSWFTEEKLSKDFCDSDFQMSFHLVPILNTSVTVRIHPACQWNYFAIFKKTNVNNCKNQTKRHSLSLMFLWSNHGWCNVLFERKWYRLCVCVKQHDPTFPTNGSNPIQKGYPYQFFLSFLYKRRNTPQTFLTFSFDLLSHCCKISRLYLVPVPKY